MTSYEWCRYTLAKFLLARRATTFAKVGTLFHRLKFGLRKAFFICFEMTTTTKRLSASQVARRYEISRQTAHYFMQKVREAMKSSESHKMNDLGFQSLI